jgi:hypothetical protein
MTTSWCLRECTAGGITFCCIRFFVTISWWRQAFFHQWCSYSEWILRRCQNRCQPRDRRAVTFWPVKTTNHRKITVCWFIFYQELNLIILSPLFHSSINEFNATSLTPFLSKLHLSYQNLMFLLFTNKNARHFFHLLLLLLFQTTYLLLL